MAWNSILAAFYGKSRNGHELITELGDRLVATISPVPD